MKVLLVASTFPASDHDAAPAFVKDLVIALHREFPDVSIDVMAPHYRDETPAVAHHAHYDEYRFDYCRPRRLQLLAGRGIVPAIEGNKALIAMVPLLFGGEALAMLQHVRRHRPDVIYAHWFTPQGVVAAFVSAITGVPFVLTSHANDVRIWRKLPGLGPALVRALLPTAKRITAVSSTTRDKMRAFFSEAEWADIEPRVAIIPMGVDVAALSQPSPTAPAALKAARNLEGSRVVYFVGRLAEKKGVAILLDACALLRARGGFDDVVTVIAGDGPLRPELEAHAQRLALGERVRFIGYVTGTEKLEAMHLADVVVVPSIEAASGDSEGFPVVIMEALAGGKIIVASDATGADSVLVDGGSGFVVPQRDALALADAIARALAMDEAERQHMADQARDAATQLDWPGIARRHHAFLLAPFAPSAPRQP